VLTGEAEAAISDRAFDERRNPGVGRRRRRRGPWAAAGVAVTMAGLIFVLASTPTTLDRRAASVLLGRQAPPLAGPSVTPAPFSSLSAPARRWVIVNFFATWCVPCQHEQSEFARFNQRHRNAGDVEIVMVVFHDDVAQVQRFLRVGGGDWPAVADAGGAAALAYGVTGVPETFLVDRNGIVVTHIVGAVTADGLDRLVGGGGQGGA
jgi:cytochrome c biogenesis protein CcmG/thiol:disulfide interchange protein DsbE